MHVKTPALWSAVQKPELGSRPRKLASASVDSGIDRAPGSLNGFRGPSLLTEVTTMYEPAEIDAYAEKLADQLEQDLGHIGPIIAVLARTAFKCAERVGLPVSYARKVFDTQARRVSN